MLFSYLLDQASGTGHRHFNSINWAVVRVEVEVRVSETLILQIFSSHLMLIKSQSKTHLISQIAVQSTDKYARQQLLLTDKEVSISDQSWSEFFLFKLRPI